MADYAISQLTEQTTVDDDHLVEVTVDAASAPVSKKMKRSTLVDGLATEAALTTHTANVSNPHSVTKAQVGLSNVDNTSDSAKPISTATQTALDGKVDKVTGKGLSTEDYTTVEKSKLAGIEAGAEVNEVSALDIANFENTTQLNARDTANRSRSNHTGTQSADTITDGTTNKAFTAVERTKLSGIATGATANSSDATLLDRTNHTGSQAISTVTGLQTALDAKLEDVDVADINATGTPSDTTYLRGDGSWSTPAGGGGGGDMAAAVYDPNSVAGDAFDMDNMFETASSKIMTASERTKLSGIAENATANASDASLLNRTNHTGTQTSATISDFDTAADARITAQKGNASGLASLDGSGKVPSAQLPAIAMTEVFEVASEIAQLALTADEGDVAIRTDLNKSYIHNGGTAGTMADWSELQTPTDTVLSVNGDTGAVTLTQDDIGDGTTYKQYSDTEKSKLAGIETGADVTDATNVAAAGAVMGSGVAKISIGTTEPTSPSIGDLWVDTN